MKQFAYAAFVAATVAAAAATPALADGPRAASGNNWPGMTQSAAPANEAATQGQPHYVLEQGYRNGGKWRSEWVLVQ